MLALAFNAPRTCARRGRALALCRTFTVSTTCFAEPEPTSDSSNSRGQSFSAIEAQSFKQFLQSPVVRAVKDAKTPRNWMGRDRPFPMNRTFVPPSPIPDEVRQTMYDEFIRDPKTNTLRVLSERFHVSLKRVDVILRLKGHEAAWAKKGNVLQTGFQEGMEHILGVKEDEKYRKQLEAFNKQQHEAAEDATRRDVHEADTLEEDERRDTLRQRYQRMYWETVPESGGEPITPGAIEQALLRAHAKERKAAASMNMDPKLMPNIKYTPGLKRNTPVVQRAKKPGRPDILFVDVGAKFIDISGRVKRIKESKRRLKRKRNVLLARQVQNEKERERHSS